MADEAVKRPNKDIISILIVALIIVIIIGMFVFWFDSRATINANVVNDNFDQQDTPQNTPQESKTCRNVQVPYDAQESYMDTVSYTDRECENKQIVYKSSDDQMKRDVVCIDSHQECKQSHTNIWGTLVCDNYETVCDNYRETATFDITNLDNENGVWSYEWRSNCRANQPLCTGTNSETLTTRGQYIQPTETKSDSYYIEYDAKGQKYLYVYFTNIPTKQVCRDVIKNRELIKYRTVTKYRTEQQCN